MASKTIGTLPIFPRVAMAVICLIYLLSKICVGFSNHLSVASYNLRHGDTMHWPIRSYHPWHVQLGFMLSSILLFKTLVLSVLISPLRRHQCPLSFSFSQEWVEQNSTSGSHLLSNILYKEERKQNHHNTALQSINLFL